MPQQRSIVQSIAIFHFEHHVVIWIYISACILNIQTALVDIGIQRYQEMFLGHKKLVEGALNTGINLNSKGNGFQDGKAEGTSYDNHQ